MIKLKNRVTILYGDCTYFDIYMIDADNDIIELSDYDGLVIGTINTNNLEDCEIIEYGDNEAISGATTLKELYNRREKQ